MKSDKFEVSKMRDDYDKIKKSHPYLFPLPFRGLVCSKSAIGMGKSNLIGNMLLKKNGYRSMFEPENIIIINPSKDLDKKFRVIIEELEIPDENVFTEYSNEVIEAVYDHFEEQGKEELEEEGTIEPKLIILDDCSFGGGLKSKKNGAISKLFCNSRHINVSILITSQFYVDFPTVARSNCSWIITGSCSQKELDKFSDEHNIMSNKKEFVKLFRKATEEPYSFFCVDYSRKASERYLDKDFQVIKQN
tara:strand:+ start:87 stop:830 length:744 start_codon:yes stop_codon:yes gene_type:complete